MSSPSRPRRPAGRLAPLVVLAAAALLLAGQAEARSRSVTGPGGRTATRTVTPYNNGGGNFGRTVTETGPNGRTATSSFSRTVNNGTVTDSRTVTGFGGGTATRTFTRTPAPQN